MLSAEVSVSLQHENVCLNLCDEAALAHALLHDVVALSRLGWTESLLCFGSIPRYFSLVIQSVA